MVIPVLQLDGAQALGLPCEHVGRAFGTAARAVSALEGVTIAAHDDEFGFTTHIRDIRSCRKLTGEGVTLMGSDMEHSPEEALPARFGGSALDYQLVEEEQGFTRPSIVVSPRVSITNDTDIVETVLPALRRGDAGAGMSGAIWKQAGSLRVRREEPRWTSRGKLLLLHVEKKAVERVTR